VYHRFYYAHACLLDTTVYVYSMTGLRPKVLEVLNSIETASPMAVDILRLGSIAGELAREERTLVNHPDGRAENVAEHSSMLSIVAPALAELYYPELDANLTARLATIHDILETYTRDTPTHKFEEVDLAAKEKLEAKALAQLKLDFAGLPGFVRLVEIYEEQQIPEARFVRVVDKLMPILVHFNDQGATLRSYTDREHMFRVPSAKNQYLRSLYPEFEELIQLREELTRLAAEHLLEEV
jgi:5'-deoxynucleotidase YfbR-like HD superfamily hydrolase